MKIDKKLEGRCFVRYVKISPLKARRVLNQIRNRSYEEAVLILKFMPHKACSIILKSLCSAASNLKQNMELDETRFVIKEARVDIAPFLKRLCPHAQGRAFPIKKHFSHITIAV